MSSFSVLFTCTLKAQNTKLYTQALLRLRRPPCWKSTARQSRTCRVVSSRAKWKLGL